MKLTIHDVGHGLCVSLIHENDNVMLWDCGKSETNCPSNFLSSERISRINYFFITNYDEDHINDLPQLREKMRISTLWRNGSIDVNQLEELKLKSGPLSPAMETVLKMMREYRLSVGEHPEYFACPEFPGVRYKIFCNGYGNEFNDTNNISLVTFLDCCGTCFLIPGDIEAPGWKALLKKDGFIEELGKVDYFIASHHGRASGYCEDVFDYCWPRAFIFSDSEIKHATQEMAGKYAKHASGTSFTNISTGYVSKRCVVTTRNDKDIFWTL